MYKNLDFFYKHKNFKVIVLQPDLERKNENKQLKRKIKTYYFREFRLLGNRFVHFIDFNPFFISKIIKILKKHKIDLIHVDFVYGINILNYLTNIPISYNSHNVEAIYWKEVGKYYFKLPIFLRAIYAKFIYLLEKRAVRCVKNINAISLDDKKEFIKIYNIPEKKITVIRRGYNSEVFENPINRELARKMLKIDFDKFIVIFHGLYFVNDANKEAIQIIKNEIAPRITNEKILFLIAGRMPPFKNQRNIKFLGYLDDLKIFLYSADIAIVPIFRGSGMRIKMMDYYSARIPIISTKKATLGIILKNDVHGYTVDEETSIEQIIRLINELSINQAKIEDFKKNIITLMEKEYNWEKILIKLEKRYKEILRET